MALAQIPESDSKGSKSPLFTPLNLLLVGLIVGGMALLWSLLRREGLLLLLLTPFAALIAKSKKNNPELRGRLLGMIEMVPGVHYRRLKETINLGNGTCVYHLHRLEKEGLIRSEKDGLFKRFYPVPQKGRGKSILALSEIRQRIVKILQESPGLSLTEISYLLEEDVQKIDYHLKKLESEGIVLKKKESDWYTMYYLREPYMKGDIKVQVKPATNSGNGSTSQTITPSSSNPTPQ